MLFSKLLRPSHVLRRNILAPEFQAQEHQAGVLVPARRVGPVFHAPARLMSALVPRNQYEIPITKKLRLPSALYKHWEIIPLFLVVVFDIVFILCGSCIACLFNKVDLQWTKHNWNCISRNMDMNKPSIHKLFTIHQKYEPWPEMQIVFDKMTAAEHRLLSRLQSCTRP